MKLILAQKMEIGLKLELVTDDSLWSSERYGIMIPQKLSMKWIIDRHAIASRDRKEMRESANFGIR